MKTRTRKTRCLRRLVPALAVVLISCGALPSISTSVDYCCRGGDVHSYRVEFRDMPEFLKPMLRDEFSIALARKGFEYTEGDAHAILDLSFAATPLAADGVDARFDAEIHAELTDSVSRELLWSGRLSREHYVTEGSYMHEAPARAAMKEALRALFEDLPDAHPPDDY